MKIGICENLLRGKRDDWADARECDQPVIDMGIPSVRNICQTCRQATLARMDTVIEGWVSAALADPERVEGLEISVAELDCRLARMHAARIPLSKIHPVRRERDRRVRLLAAVQVASVE